ncbi:MAG TPA: peptidylprolyl isomerase [Gemmatimonadales bacterium]|jgi:cyclophilin family peptidyl-prolyl cis-trans isomerase
MHRSLRCTLPFVAVLASPLAAQRADTAGLQRILVAEDARGLGGDGVTPLIDGLTAKPALLRLTAVRGLGRLQRPESGDQIAALLHDDSAAVRAEAANALAQSVNRAARRTADSLQPAVLRAGVLLAAALERERAPAARDAIADALGRLPFADTASGHAAERAIVAVLPPSGTFGTVRGLYWLALYRSSGGGLGAESVDRLRHIAATHADSLAVVRRVALLALTSMRALDSATVMRGVADRDPQVRRLALAGVATMTPAARSAAIQTALATNSTVVRIAAVSAYRAGSSTPDCTPLVAMTHDPVDAVALVAIDSLALPCSNQASVNQALQAIIATPVTRGPVDHRWQRAAHALVSLAHRDPAGATATIAKYAESPAWGVRLAAADAAVATNDTSTLRVLARDADHNVAEAAITGLARRVRHGADPLYIEALSSAGNQTIRAAAMALARSPDTASLPALYRALARLTAGRRENSRDPRVAILQRVAEIGHAGDSAEVVRYLADFDTTVAALAAKTLTTWTGRPWAADPHPLPIAEAPLAGIAVGKPPEIAVTMAASSGGGRFVIRLFSAEAPATVARIVRLVREHYYDGHVFQRVEPNFVVQGGGGDASEYVGDSTFMRDELGLPSHLQWTLGISSRGRDTGDAQWFINLVDNTRLDHEYTVAGVIVSGQSVAAGILAGDRIAQVKVIR